MGRDLRQSFLSLTFIDFTAAAAAAMDVERIRSTAPPKLPALKLSPTAVPGAVATSYWRCKQCDLVSRATHSSIRFRPLTHNSQKQRLAIKNFCLACRTSRPGPLGRDTANSI